MAASEEGRWVMAISLPQLPQMRCDDHCGKCCGPVFVSEAEYQRVASVVQRCGIRPQRNGWLTCPLYIDGKCSVYHARPAICKLFGHAPGMTCAHGYNTPATASDIEKYRRYFQSSTKGGTEVRILHELVYSVEELTEDMIGELAKGGV